MVIRIGKMQGGSFLGKKMKFAKRVVALSVTILFSLLILIGNYSAYREYSCSGIFTELTDSQEIVVSDQKFIQPIFVLSSYSVIYKEDSYQTVIYEVSDTVTEVARSNNFLSFDQYPDSIRVLSSNSLAELEIKSKRQCSDLTINYNLNSKKKDFKTTNILYGVKVYDIESYIITTDEQKVLLSSKKRKITIEVLDGRFTSEDFKYGLIYFTSTKDNLCLKISYEYN